MVSSAARRDSCWVCPRSSDFALRDWPDGSVLYDETSGEIQRINSSAARVMALFLLKPEWNSGEITRVLFGEEHAPDDIESVERVLANFQSLNLIKRTPY